METLGELLLKLRGEGVAGIRFIMLEFAFFTEVLWLKDESLEASDNLP